jgi:hypothetical protein
VGDIDREMIFDRKNYAVNKGIPFISIADHVEIGVDLKTKQTSCLQLALETQR